MHEYSLAAGILKFCEGEMAKHPGTEMREVTLLIGVMGGVDGNLLGRALNHLKENGPFARTLFINEASSMLIVCNKCKGESSVYDIALKCPLCNEEDIQIRGGQELLIKNIKFARMPES